MQSEQSILAIEWFIKDAEAGGRYPCSKPVSMERKQESTDDDERDLLDFHGRWRVHTGLHGVVPRRRI